MTYFDWSRQLDVGAGFTLTQQKLTQYASNQQLCLCMLTIALLTVSSLLMLTPDERFVSQSKTPIMFDDINGDGRKDIVWFGSNNVYVAYQLTNKQFSPLRQSEKSGFFTSKTGWGSLEEHPRAFFDIDEDGHKDLVGLIDGRLAISYGTLLLSQQSISQDHKPLVFGYQEKHFLQPDNQYTNADWRSYRYTLGEDRNYDGVRDIDVVYELGELVLQGRDRRTRFYIPRLRDGSIEAMKSLDPESRYQELTDILTRFNRDGVYLMTDPVPNESVNQRIYAALSEFVNISKLWFKEKQIARALCIFGIRNRWRSGSDVVKNS